MRAYTMRGVASAADRAVALARSVLVHTAPASLVHDVQADPRFQHRGVDLLWERGPDVLGVEVKGDRQGARRGTFFFELISNAEKDSPGCFLYSEADVLAYVFVDVLRTHLLTLPEVRAWFLARHATRPYPLKATRTRTGQALYTTVGAVVPVSEVVAAVPSAVVVHEAR